MTDRRLLDPARQFRPAIERLEDRSLLSTAPVLGSWLTADLGKYALAISQYDESAGAQNTWPNNVPAGATYGGGQLTPVLGDVAKLSYSEDWVYLETVSGLPSFVTGPWYNGDGSPFMNFPAEQKKTIRITRSPQPATTAHTATGLGQIAVGVDGIAFFNFEDGFSWDPTNQQDSAGMMGGGGMPAGGGGMPAGGGGGTPPAGVGGQTSNTGIWNRNAFFGESVTFDPAGAHQPGNGEYHYHNNPIALRAQLGDNVVYTGTVDRFPYDGDVKTEAESGAGSAFREDTTALHHSPIIGWSFDGYPVYGVYGYANPNDPNSAVVRMTSSYRLRSVPDRTTLPGWAARIQFGESAAAVDGVYQLSAAQAGPAISAEYPLGRYNEDYEYVRNLGSLDQYNGRWAVTPEFPGGTYAYFVTIDELGESAFPYIIGPEYYGQVTSGVVPGVTEDVVTAFDVTKLQGEAVEAVGTGVGNEVRVFTTAGVLKTTYRAFEAGFLGGVRTGTGDFNGDSVGDVVVAAGPGGGPRVQVFDGFSGAVTRSFFAYDAGFSGGVFVAVGDVNGDGFSDIVTGAGAGGGSHVKVFDGRTGELLRSFYAYDASFTGGTNVAAGDVNGDGYADIITGAGAGGGSHVKVFDGQTEQLLQSFGAYVAGFTGGVSVAGGDLNRDGFAEIITGAGDGGNSHVKVFDGNTQAVSRSFYAYDTGFDGGVNVGARDVSGDGYADIVTGTGPGGGPRVRAFSGRTLQPLLDFYAFDSGDRGGVFVG